MARPILPALLLLGACSDGPVEDVEPRANSVEELSNRLDKLSDRTSEDIEPPPRLGVLRAEEIAAPLGAGPACSLHKDGRSYLVVSDAGALARIDGRRVALAVSGPVGPTGGFFTAPGVTVSIGRIRPTAAGADEYGRGWPARVTIGGDRERPIEKHEAIWTCRR